MGPPKKGKAGSKSKSSKKAEGKTKEPKKPQPQMDPSKDLQLQVLPQERIQTVKPYWETIPDKQRVDLLSIDLNELKLRADDLAEKVTKQAALEAAEAAELNEGTTVTVSLEPGLDKILDEGTRRLREKLTWKVWLWPSDKRVFFNADSFRQYAEEHHIDEELRKFLPRGEGKPAEKAAERALQERMSELLQKVHTTNRQLQDNMQTQQTRRIGRRDRSNCTDQVPHQIRACNLGIITIILEALEQEHDYLFSAVLDQATHFVCDILPAQMRESTHEKLSYSDLEKLPPMALARICEWLIDKVHNFSSKIRAEPKDAEEEEEEEGVGDVDLFILTEDRMKLVPNVKWLHYLQERLLGEDGHPRKVQEGEDPHRMGLVLEWVYGTIVSTAGKARSGTRCALGMQPITVDQAHGHLVGALQDMQSWEAQAKRVKELLQVMLKSRLEAAELATQYNIRPNPTGRSSPPQDAQLATDGQNVATDGQEGATDGQQVATDGQQVATDGQQVATDGQKAATHGQEAATDGQAAATGGQEVATDGQQVATDGQKAATDGQEAATDGQAAATDGQAAATAGQAAATAGQAAATAGQTAATDGQNAATDGQEEFFDEESAELPDIVIIALLRREHLLTIVELNAFSHEQSNGERTLSSLQTQLHQGEPEFDRLRRELEEVKNQPRGLEGTFRTAAEMERHRAQLADAAIEEQLEAQTAFREQGARLQEIYETRQHIEHQMVLREEEIKALEGWAEVVNKLFFNFKDGLKELEDGMVQAMLAPWADANAAATAEEVSSAVASDTAMRSRLKDLTAQRHGIAKLRKQFSKDVQQQLYSDKDDRQLFQRIQSQLKWTETRLESGWAVLHHLEAQLINVACDDPGAAIGAQLALPLLQERLDAKAQEYARHKAAQAEEDIIKMEDVKLEKERLERERKLKQKQKAKDRVRSEKDKLDVGKDAAEKEAAEPCCWAHTGRQQAQWDRLML